MLHINSLIELVLELGNEIARLYKLNDTKITYKQDNSPFTTADQIANIELMSFLPKINNIPIISEEANSEDNIEILSHTSKYWVIDPIDGTESFIKKHGDFTINIGLIESHIPIFGLIYQPITKVLYFSNNGAFKTINGTTTQIHVNHDISNGMKTITSTRKNSNGADLFLAKLPISSQTKATSSIKFCSVAEGESHIYPNFSNLNIWDIAAGDAILRAAGGYMYDDKFNIIKYEDNLQIPKFIATSINKESYLKILR